VELNEEKLVTEIPEYSSLKFYLMNWNLKPRARILSEASLQQKQAVRILSLKLSLTVGPGNSFFCCRNRTSSVFTPKSDISSVVHDYRLVSDDNELRKVIQLALERKEICFDTETTSIEALDSEIVALALSWKKDQDTCAFTGNEKRPGHSLKLSAVA